eukprot:CAMPEP_0171654656 /NCGR_PEP_ID=MMETSP0990-20121206/40367_1 /TAXON_ID=483369 /ORGANISM="non described non described, Strain CCMP2098" /LENGTH=158 /DNA_ID=CAMNT_0012234483 /DNA_START=99 /DNA_END=575 /DNA_ORIENTATION=+
MSSGNALSSTGWGTREWNWGYASGRAHDEAFAMRSRLSSPDQRREWLQECVNDSLGLEEVKLCLALRWQRSGHEGKAGDFSRVMESMSQGKFEGTGAPTLLPTLTKAMPSVGLDSEIDVTAVFTKNDFSVPAASALEENINVISVAILLQMGFLGRGL